MGDAADVYVQLLHTGVGTAGAGSNGSSQLGSGAMLGDHSMLGGFGSSLGGAGGASGFSGGGGGGGSSSNSGSSSHLQASMSGGSSGLMAGGGLLGGGGGNGAVCSGGGIGNGIGGGSGGSGSTGAGGGAGGGGDTLPTIATLLGMVEVTPLLADPTREKKRRVKDSVRNPLIFLFFLLQFILSFVANSGVVDLTSFFAAGHWRRRFL